MTEIEVKQQAEEKAGELAKTLGVKVHPMVFRASENDYVTGFLKEPTMQVKLAVLDKSMSGAISAAEEMLDVVILKEHSDTRLFSGKSDDDNLRLGAVMAAYDLIKFSVNLFKKK